jgi:hypothetical protein
MTRKIVIAMILAGLVTVSQAMAKAARVLGWR